MVLGVRVAGSHRDGAPSREVVLRGGEAGRRLRGRVRLPRARRGRRGGLDVARGLVAAAGRGKQRREREQQRERRDAARRAQGVAQGVAQGTQTRVLSAGLLGSPQASQTERRARLKRSIEGPSARDSLLTVAALEELRGHGDMPSAVSCSGAASGIARPLATQPL